MNTISLHNMGGIPSKTLLTNESEVESKFLSHILQWLGWNDENIKTKHSLDEFNCGTGTRKLPYKPDYVIVNQKNIPVLVIDAKSPKEVLENHTNQCSSYCLRLNEKKETVHYFILSNGFRTLLYDWKGGQLIMELSYDDFASKNKKFFDFSQIVSADVLLTTFHKKEYKDFTLKKISKEDAQKTFRSCHKLIWKSEKYGVNKSFMEFIKLIFLKIASDKKIHKVCNYSNGSDTIHLSPDEVLFSEHWIKKNTSEMQKNPMKDIQFNNIMSELRKEIKRNDKKRLFDDNETIELKASTIKSVVKKLEHYDLYSIDEDLNGRLFETFLNATMRGNDLGQYFTPRSIVKLGVRLANLKSDENHIDKVLDASCGTGGFLIEAFQVMKEKIQSKTHLTNSQIEDLLQKVRHESIYGIDAAKDPKLARIARINMYLHGDGGSQIYMSDGLIKDMKPDETDIEEFRDETESMKNVFLPESFDVVLTNPPFSMSLSIDNEQDKDILDKYELLHYEDNERRSLRTGVMFIERYEGLLKKGGKLITVIDNTILNSPEFGYVRDYIRNKFIIKAVISLHGDAFQQSKARVKTSLLFLEKKRNVSDRQTDAFMAFSVKLGVDDKPITTPQSEIDEARKQANEEIKHILSDYEDFKNGKESINRVPPKRMSNRLDVKYCIPFKGRYVKKWYNDGFDTKKLSDIFTEESNMINPSKDNPSDVFKILTIKYDGFSSIEEERIGVDISGKGYIVKSGNIVMSRYNAYYGAIGYISEEGDGAFASKSYIVLKPCDEVSGIYAWAVLRTIEIRADMLDSAIGMGRSTVKWEEIKDIEIPWISDDERRMNFVEQIKESWQNIKRAKDNLNEVQDELGILFGTNGEDSQFRFNANKPPK